MNYFWRKPGKTLISLIALFMTVGLLGTRVYALDNGETQPNGNDDTPVETDPQGNEDGEQGETGAISSVTITPLLQEDAPEDLSDYLDIAEHKGDLVVDIYKVASFYNNKFTVEKNAFDLSEYDLNNDFLLKITEDEGGAETDNFAAMIKKWDELAQDLTGQVKTGYNSDPAKPIMYNKRGELEETAGESGDLGPGLYLILAHGKDLERKDQFEDVKVKPADPSGKEETVVTTIMNTDLFTYNFRPVLIVAPSKSADANQRRSDKEPPHIATSDEGKWIKDVNVYLKPSQKERLGNLRIYKTVDPLEQRGTQITPMTAVFRITGWKYDAKTGEKGDEIYHNVASITVPSNDSVLLEGIPAGTYVEVEEIYNGSGYKFLEQNPMSVIIKAEPKPEPEPTEGGEEPQEVSFKFKNAYDDELKKGYGVMNNFTKTGENSWHVENDLGGQWDFGGEDEK